MNWSRTILTAFLVFLLAACVIKSNAQETPSPIATPTAVKPSESKRAPELQRALDAFVGSWIIDEMYPPSSLLPSGGKGHGTELSRAGPGGMSLIYEYHSINPRGEMSGMAVLWWDAKANGFRELYCTSGGSNGCSMVDAQIRWEGDNLVFTGSFEARGKRMFSREVWSDIKSDFHTMTIADGEREWTI